MSVEHLSPPVWVNTPKSLERMIADLSAQPRLAVDTESNSLHAYQESVCLIQFSTPQVDYLLDPLALDDLSALAPIFANPNIEKVFHAAEYDLICLRRDYGFSFAHLFDTMQAARILGYPAVGLDHLLAEKFGVAVDKRHQKADWGARPLTPEQIHYARLDTHYLLPLRDLLETELRAKGLWALASEDFCRACEVDELRTSRNNSAWGRFEGRRDLSLRELTILSELTACRESLAARLDRPPFKVVSDEMLIAMARALPQTPDDLAKLGLSARQIHTWGEAFLAAVRRGVDAPLVKRKPSERPSEAVLRRLEKLKAWRKRQAQAMGVQSDIILPKTYMHFLAENSPRDAAELAKVMAPLPWRLEQFGAQILEVLGEKK
jgi:ribonuclease D